MENPTPISTLIHTTTMITTNIYLIAQSTPLFTTARSTLTLVTIIDTLTTIFTTTITLIQIDIKQIITYSTVNQLNYIFLTLKISTPIAAIFHLTTHAFFKTLLFLGSSSVIHAMDNV